MKKPEFFDYEKYLSSKTSKDKPKIETKIERKNKISMTTKAPEISEEISPVINETSEATITTEETQSVENIENKEIIQQKNVSVVVEKEQSVEKVTKKSKQNKKKAEKIVPVESIKNALDSALDEDVAEIAEFSVTKNVDEILAKKKPSFKRNLYFVIGIAVSFMSLIGFIFSVYFCAGIVKDFAENTTQKEEFARFIYPIVIVDPSAYKSTDQLSSDAVISAAIWDIILYGDTSKYTTEYGNMTVPQLDVENHATSLFGSGLTFDHKTLGDTMLTFYYNAETKSYTIPVSPKYFPYSPSVESIKRDGDIYTLKVGYISPSPAWLVTDKKQKPKPAKYMEYVVSKKNNNYTLKAINDVEGSYIPGDL